MYDIAIIGLGPAGATLARLLDKRYTVIAIDKKKSKAGKCCGGLLSPDAQRALARFNICLQKDVLVDPQIFSVRVMDLDNHIEAFYQRFYINMNRAKFDDFLISLIPDRVETCYNTVCTRIDKEDYTSYSMELKTNGVTRTETAKIIIGADGANSIVRNTFYGNHKIHRYISIQEWYEDRTNSPSYSCIFDKEITDSYCWAISKDQYFVLGGAFPVKDSGRSFEALREKIKKSGISFGKAVKREGCFVCVNKRLTGTCTGKNGAYLAGEAAGMISPSSLEGISYAMESARKLAEAINENLQDVGRRYFMGTLGIRIKIIFKIMKMLFISNRILRKIIMKSGVKTIRAF
ncbi:MAG: FAD-binding protein [Deltaproteobacteria bacterium]|jgi:flavin-dependent dehydrogenase|nr:FAD-binding protein [Deltaproteobacteria bacterium]